VEISNRREIRRRDASERENLKFFEIVAAGGLERLNNIALARNRPHNLFEMTWRSGEVMLIVGALEE